MAYASLADFLEELEQAGELARVAAEVDPAQEAAEITRRVAASGGPALLFQNVGGRGAAVATNLLGTAARICRAAGAASMSDLADRVREFLRTGGEPAGWLERLRPSAENRWAPRTAKSGACQQVIRLASDVDLHALPALSNWPGETGPFIHGGLSLTSDPQTGRTGVGRYDFLIIDRNRLAARWNRRQPAARHFSSCHDQSTRLPIAIVLGGDPVYPLIAGGAEARLVDPWPFGGILRQRPIELIKCRTHELRVPADADFILEGFLDPAEPQVTAGPMGTAGGTYAPPREAPVVHITAVTQRTNPVFPALILDGAIGEVRAVASAVERILMPLARAAIPDLVEYAAADLAPGARVVFASIRKRYACHARQIASALWGWEPLMTAKLLVLVDDDVDIHDPRQVLGRLAAHVHPGRDAFFHQGPADPDDHAAPVAEIGHAMAIDATAKLPGEHAREWPEPTIPARQVVELVESSWARYGISGAATGNGAVRPADAPVEVKPARHSRSV